MELAFACCFEFKKTGFERDSRMVAQADLIRIEIGRRRSMDAYPEKIELARMAGVYNFYSCNAGLHTSTITQATASRLSILWHRVCLYYTKKICHSCSG